MEFNMDIDTGGTFTDGFIRGDGRIELVKVDTTPHDFTVCFMECIEEAARRFGLQSAMELLTQMKTLRLSTTIGTNALIQATGPKLGLLVTKGSGENAYAPANATNPAIDFIIPKDMIIGIEEEIDALGSSVKAPEYNEVLTAVKNLLEKGARRIVVSLANSPLNAAHEKMCREIVLSDYPAHYLGTVPLVLSSEVSSVLDDQYRTNAVLIDAYIHREMVHYLYKADEDVRNRRYKWPLLIMHASGGVCRVAKTKAIDTCDSGPAAGLFGAAFLARLHGIDNVITVDVGGTSTDIGLVANGEPSYTEERKMSDIPIKERIIESFSIGGGGSSVASSKTDTSQIQVGPESAGALPGPACYGLGGFKATVTDAWVSLGYIDPDFFLGGRRKLDAAQARDAIKENVAGPLNLTVEEAAESILREMYSQSAQSVDDFLREKGVDAKKVTMFAFGGAGGLACSGIAKAAGIPKIYLFPFGAQFCAFGSTCTDMLHHYSAATQLSLGPDSSSDIIEEFNKKVNEMIDDAYFDMEGEGFGREGVSLILEVVISSSKNQPPTVIRWDPIVLNNENDIEELRKQYRNEGNLDLEEIDIIREIRLKASSHLPNPDFPKYEVAGTEPGRALKGTRTVYWEGAFRDAQVFDQSLLESGNIVRGLSIVESASTSILVPPGSRYLVDQYLNGVIEEE